MTGASTQDGTYPRPQLVREQWRSLDGEWEFAWDDDDRGLADRWFADLPAPESATADPRTADAVTAVPPTARAAAGLPTLFGGATGPRPIRVPFAPESALSGIGETGFHSVAWYRLLLEIEHPADDARVLLHFGAVDHSCRVWLDGTPVGEHVGGQTPFTLDVTDALAAASSIRSIVVRAFDDPRDLEVPRGKQDWEAEPHVIWYTRTTGIWQSVWLETVPSVHITAIDWSTDIVEGSVRCEVSVSRRSHGPLRLTVSTDLEGGSATVDVISGTGVAMLHPRDLCAGQAREALQWSPENPVLVDATLSLDSGDVVDSYFGIRSVEATAGTFQLNGVPYFVRAVLEQGFWAESLLTAPSDDARRREVELIKELGFNTARIHQKVEDPRFLYWADRLGLMLWGETAAAYDFSARAVELLTTEWMQVIARDRSHPSIVVWVPMNESWGVQDIARSNSQRQFAQSLASLTRALDPRRPVISNDGWEHVDSDIFTIHDYSPDAAVLKQRYGSTEAVRASVDSAGPAGRELSLTPALSDRVRRGELPVIVSEFGGISFAGDSHTWGYALVDSDVAYRDILRDIFRVLNTSAAIHGFCYTQLTDTMQEANGLLTADRRPKLPIPLLREIITGQVEGKHSFVWPPATGG